MANIQAFRGLRYDLSRVGSLSSVVAPPYDVIDGSLQDELYERNPHNVTRLILNRGDDLLDGQTIYERAAEFLKAWRRDGVLMPENVGSIYVYHQSFTFEGQEFNRRGFMARINLEPFGSGSIFPHEETHSRAKEDRFKLMTACRANLSQIFGIFPDSQNEVQEILEHAIQDRTPLQATDDQGVEHKMWMVNDSEAIAAAAKLMGPKPIYIADGHHRYETACNIQASLRDSENIEGDNPVDYVMMMCVSMQDPGMAILPTHRLFRGVSPINSTELMKRLRPSFNCEVVGKGPEYAKELWELIAVEDLQSTMGFYCRADDSWVLARLADEGLTKMKEDAPGQSDDWRSLGVALLHKLVIEKLLGYDDLPTPLYVHSISEVIDGLEHGDAAGRDATGQLGSGDPYELGCLVMPATVEHVKAISEHGERMPAKSTYFYPKLLSGLVINPLE
jgi:uncharacterized protein (DUF1015 family)